MCVPWNGNDNKIQSFRRIVDKIRCAIETIKSAEGNELLIVVVDKRISQMMLQDYDK